MRDRPSVLVVDDGELNLHLMTAYLSDLDCSVVTASDGIQALEAVEAADPDVVLLDVMMPGLDGFEVCRRLKSSPRTRRLPVVIISALADKADLARGLDAGADDYLTKPVDHLKLVATLRSLLSLQTLHDHLDTAERRIFALAREVDATEGYTESHTERVGRSARILGEACGVKGANLEELYLGGVIHDIGKIGVPRSLLLKAGPLGPGELEVMRSHVLVGEEMVRPLRSAAWLIPIVRHHHEHVDGSGYPDSLRGNAIPLHARIVAICDAFDAMVSDRPYRAGLGIAAARAILLGGAGTQWDAELVQLFLSRAAGVASPDHWRVAS